MSLVPILQAEVRIREPFFWHAVDGINTHFTVKLSLTLETFEIWRKIVNNFPVLCQLRWLWGIPMSLPFFFFFALTLPHSLMSFYSLLLIGLLERCPTHMTSPRRLNVNQTSLWIPQASAPCGVKMKYSFRTRQLRFTSNFLDAIASWPQMQGDNHSMNHFLLHVV